MEPTISKSKKSKSNSIGRPLHVAFGISILINSLMGVAGALSNASWLSGLSYLSTGIGAPTAFLVGSMLKPKGQSMVEITLAGVEALAFSIVFYTVIVWIVLRIWLRLRPSKASDSNP